MVEFHHPEDDRNFGPIALAREVHKRVMEGGDHDISTSLARVKVRDNKFGGYQFHLGFHERRADSEFRFNPRIDSGRQMGMEPGTKATPIEELSNRVGTLAMVMEEAYNTNPWEFAELEAASIGGTGQLTDYEFEYETGTPDGNFSDDDLERAIRQVQ